jgi:DNA polymerase-3 subunit delta'
VGGFRTRGQPAAVETVAGLLAGGLPHAIVLAGPSGSGKTTLALDLAAALLCTSPNRADRPCGTCRGCRLARDGNHPDLHRLAPEGPGGQIRIDPARALGTALALHSVEGGPRVAIVEHADRMNEDAQNALLKTLEEPPEAVTIVLCADDEDRLLPTIRSRSARVRLGSVGVRAMEELLAELGLAQPPEAGRIARAAAGRPGRAVAYAGAPDAVTIRGEVGRTLVDLLAAPAAPRLASGRQLLARASDAAAALDLAAADERGTSRSRARGRVPATTPAGDPAGAAPPAGRGAEPEADASRARAPATERRRALAWLLDTWADVARVLVSVALGDVRGIRDQGLADDLGAFAGNVQVADLAAFLARLAETSRRLESNVAPELALDVLVLAWPRVAFAA